MIPRPSLVPVTTVLCLFTALGRASVLDSRSPGRLQCQRPTLTRQRWTSSLSNHKQAQRPVTSNSDKMVDLVRLSAADLQILQTAGSLTSTELAKLCLQQIEKYDRKGPELRALIAVVPQDVVLERTTFLDEERRAGRVIGPLHGIPIILKVEYIRTASPWQQITVYRKSLTLHPNGEYSLLKDPGRSPNQYTKHKLLLLERFAKPPSYRSSCC